MNIINIVYVGKKTSPIYAQLIDPYVKRLQADYKINWRMIAPDHGTEQESKIVLSVIKLTDFVIVLDKRGRIIDNQLLASKLEQIATSGRQLTFVIGGAYGLNQAVLDRADFVWSLSDLVLTHQMVRLILIEQIYRSQAIIRQHPYHHE